MLALGSDRRSDGPRRQAIPPGFDGMVGNALITVEKLEVLAYRRTGPTTSD